MLTAKSLLERTSEDVAATPSLLATPTPSLLGSIAATDKERVAADTSLAKGFFLNNRTPERSRDLRSTRGNSMILRKRVGKYGKSCGRKD